MSNTIKKEDFKENIASISEVKEFLTRAKFGGYQSIELPYGLKTPGMDRTKSANIIFRNSVKDKSVLDIGCKYGFFCHEALLKGAKKVVGIDISQDNVYIAQNIVRLWGRDIEIRLGDFLEMDTSEKFDVVLFLNVLHHMISPVQALQKIGEIAQGIVVIEFSTIFDHHTGFSKIQRICLQSLFKKVPFTFVSDILYHRTWYFTKDSFLNLFVKQLKLFRKTEFIDSPRKKGRLIAFCWM